MCIETRNGMKNNKSDKSSTVKQSNNKKVIDKNNNDKYEVIKLDNQLCFPLYACAKEIVRRYKPYLDVIDLTYTQYITMMVLWEDGQINVKELGARLYLDSGTLTPVLKRLEQKNLIIRQRDVKDERSLIVSLTDEGRQLREKAVEVPYKMAGCVALDEKDAKEFAKRNPDYFIETRKPIESTYMQYSIGLLNKKDVSGFDVDTYIDLIPYWIRYINYCKRH